MAVFDRPAYHANIHKALKYAVKIDLIDVNPADKVEHPKKDRYVGSFYDADEVNTLFEAAILKSLVSAKKGLMQQLFI